LLRKGQGHIGFCLFLACMLLVEGATLLLPADATVTTRRQYLVGA